MSLDKGTAELLQQLNENTPDLHDIDITVDMSREGAKAMFIGFESPITPSCHVRDCIINDNEITVPVRIYSPYDSVGAKKPAVVFFHGGGWSLGDLDCYDGLMRSLCSQSGAIFLSVDYRLAPENKFPAGLNDCIAAVNWLRVNGAEFGVDTDRIAIMGDSAGGNLALVTASKIQLQKAFDIAALYLIYPVVDSASPHERYSSREQFGNGHFLLTKEAITDTCTWYLDDTTMPANPDVSPLFMNDFSHLPNTSVLLAGHDPLHDEGKCLANKLKASGVLRRTVTFESSIHAFVSFGILPIAQQARSTLSNQIKTDLFGEKI